MFDNLSFGMNPKDGACLVERTQVDQVDAWLVEYWEKWIDQCKFLPEKFLLSGHSFGAY